MSDIIIDDLAKENINKFLQNNALLKKVVLRNSSYFIRDEEAEDFDEYKRIEGRDIIIRSRADITLERILVNIPVLVDDFYNILSDVEIELRLDIPIINLLFSR